MVDGSQRMNFNCVGSSYYNSRVFVSWLFLWYSISSSIYLKWKRLFCSAVKQFIIILFFGNWNAWFCTCIFKCGFACATGWCGQIHGSAGKVGGGGAIARKATRPLYRQPIRVKGPPDSQWQSDLVAFHGGQPLALSLNNSAGGKMADIQRCRYSMERKKGGECRDIDNWGLNDRWWNKVKDGRLERVNLWNFRIW